MLKIGTICLLVVVLLLTVQMCSQSGIENYVSDADLETIDFDELAMNLYNPSIMGVAIQNKRNIFKKSAAQSGMFLPGMSMQLGLEASKTLSGRDAYEANVATVRDSLEMQQTQDYLRHNLAASMTGYIPPDGVMPHGLWYQRTYVDRLDQPGLKPYPSNYVELSEAGF